MVHYEWSSVFLLKEIRSPSQESLSTHLGTLHFLVHQVLTAGQQDLDHWSQEFDHPEFEFPSEMYPNFIYPNQNHDPPLTMVHNRLQENKNQLINHWTVQ